MTRDQAMSIMAVFRVHAAQQANIIQGLLAGGESDLAIKLFEVQRATESMTAELQDRAASLDERDPLLCSRKLQAHETLRRRLCLVSKGSFAG